MMIKQDYAKGFNEFDWGYKIVASPVPYTKKKGNIFAKSYSTNIIEQFVLNTIRSIEHHENTMTRSYQPLRFVYCLDSGIKQWPHVNILLGNICYLSALQVKDIFERNKFGYVEVCLWDAALDTGYMWRSLDPTFERNIHAERWNTNVMWNRRYKQQMKLARKWLLKTHYSTQEIV